MCRRKALHIKPIKPTFGLVFLFVDSYQLIVRGPYISGQSLQSLLKDGSVIAVF